MKQRHLSEKIISLKGFSTSSLRSRWADEVRRFRSTKITMATIDGIELSELSESEIDLAYQLGIEDYINDDEETAE